MRMRVRPERSSGRVEALAPADLVFPHFFDERCALQAKHTGCIGNDIAAGGERGADQRLLKRGDHLAHVALAGADQRARRSEEHTSELQSLMRISYAVFCLKNKNKNVNRVQ